MKMMRDQELELCEVKMKNQKLNKAPLPTRKTGRVKFYAGIYFALVMTLLSPISPVHAPVISATEAEAVEPDYRGYAEQIALLEYSWNAVQFACLDKMWTKESHWNPLADNPKSSAFGIAQMLKEKSTNGYVQIANGLKYIQHRYENPCQAWKFWERNNWY